MFSPLPWVSFPSRPLTLTSRRRRIRARLTRSARSANPIPSAARNSRLLVPRRLFLMRSGSFNEGFGERNSNAGDHDRGFGARSAAVQRITTPGAGSTLRSRRSLGESWSDTGKTVDNLAPASTWNGNSEGVSPNSSC